MCECVCLCESQGKQMGRKKYWSDYLLVGNVRNRPNKTAIECTDRTKEVESKEKSAINGKM